MNKRKIDINDLKKKALRGKKYRTINARYDTVLAFFKEKEVKDKEIFQVDFIPLISDLVNQITTYEFAYKLEKNSTEPIKPLNLNEKNVKLDSLNLKGLSQQYPIGELVECLYLTKDEKTQRKIMGISHNKLMVFYKKMRNLYSQFCVCGGQKFILESYDLANVYQLFKLQWNKIEEKGKQSQLNKLQKNICRSLYFYAIIIENNIFYAIDEREKKMREEMAEPGTKSQKKKNFKNQNPQVSSTYSFCSADIISNFSNTLRSQKSNQQDIFVRHDYTEKSEKIVSRSKYNLFDKAQMKSLKFKIVPVPEETAIEHSNYQINLLTNQVQNIIIERAFKLQRWQDSCQRPYFYMEYYPQQANSFYPYYQTSPTSSGGNRKNIDFYNLVEIRKNTSRYNGKKYP